MANVLFVTWDGGGNVPPTLGIAAELRRRGHAVRFLGHAQQRTQIEAKGLPFEAYTHARSWSSLQRVTPFTVGRIVVFDPGPGQDLTESVERDPVDLVVVDAVLSRALNAAERIGLRRVVLMHTILGGGPRLLARSSDRWRQNWTRADAVLVTTLRDLDPVDPRSLPEQAYYTGPVWQDHPPQPAAAGTGEPVVLVSLSTNNFPGQRNTLQNILNAIAGLPIRTIVTTGPAVDPRQLRTPANAELHRYLPHAEVLPRATLVVGHGGHDTTMRALAHDLPLLIMPMHWVMDQRAIGHLLRHKGAAKTLPKRARPPRIRAAIEDLLRDGTFRAVAAELGAQIRRRDGAANAADHLASLLPVTRK
jgi:UDP:flavonoid glycosyltransferase YjiC (YdhE family)